MAGEEAVEEKGRAIKEQCGAYKDEEIVGGGGGGQAGEPPWSHNWLHCLCRPRAPPLSPPICPIHSIKIG